MRENRLPAAHGWEELHPVAGLRDLVKLCQPPVDRNERDLPDRHAQLPGQGAERQRGRVGPFDPRPPLRVIKAQMPAEVNVYDYRSAAHSLPSAARFPRVGMVGCGSQPLISYRSVSARALKMNHLIASDAQPVRPLQSH